MANVLQKSEAIRDLREVFCARGVTNSLCPDKTATETAITVTETQKEAADMSSADKGWRSTGTGLVRVIPDQPKQEAEVTEADMERVAAQAFGRKPRTVSEAKSTGETVTEADLDRAGASIFGRPAQKEARG